MRRALRIIGILVLVPLAVGAAVVATRQNLKYEDTPYPEVAATIDSAVVERGRYIVRNAAPCAACHTDPKQHAAYQNGEDVPLSGGFLFDIPPARIYARNITADSATGLGAVSDRAIARALRNGVGHDGRALFPFMEMQGLADDDLVAVVSYLRTQAPVRNEVPAHEYRVLGKVLRATVMSKPIGPSATPPTVAPHGASLENGRYIVESVALCWACHTSRNEMSGELNGPRFGGARGFIDDSDRSKSWAPPNITSDPETGRLGKLTEDQFVARFKQGRVIPGSPMPWQSFSRLAEEDLRAMYKYLMSLPPVKNDVGPPMVNVTKQ